MAVIGGYPLLGHQCRHLIEQPIDGNLHFWPTACFGHLLHCLEQVTASVRNCRHARGIETAAGAARQGRDQARHGGIGMAVKRAQVG